ncbi:MAG TPA: hypothetical protein VIZ22_11345 [Candidatus Limnocylindrales bacterium]
MTKDRDFDRIARAWLDLMPDEAPDRTVAAVLHAVDATPQVRRTWGRLTWRSIAMNRTAFVLGAAAIVVAAGALVMLRTGPTSNVGSPPTPSATIPPSPSPAGAAAPVPGELQAIWMGEHRDLVAPDAGSLIEFRENTFAHAQSAGSSVQLLQSTAAATGDRQLRLVSAAAGDGCEQGDIGTYSWSLNPSGRNLTVTHELDACQARADAIAGDWWLMGCTTPDDNCLGALDAGTFSSQFITPRLKPGESWSPVFGALTYTVPDGWANASDWPESFELVPASELPPIDEANRRRHINLLTRPSAMTQDKPCSDMVEPGVGRTIDDIVTWLGTVPGLITTAPTAITIDGHPGQWLDVRLDPAWDKTCDGGSGPMVAYLNPGIAISSDERERVLLVDLGDDDVIAIAVWARDKAAFDSFIPEAMTVIESFTFK